MVKNEKGSTLVFVLLIFLVFITLGLAILSATISGTSRTEKREDQIVDNLDYIRAVKEGVAAIEVYISQNGNKINSYNTNEYNQAIKVNLLDRNNLTYQISDLSTTSEFKDKIGSSYTRVLLVESRDSTGKKTGYKQKVYITAMPSFLKYALGSRKSLTINGSPLIDGDIYSSDTLKIGKDATYIYKDKPLIVSTKLPALKKTTGNVYIGNKTLSLCASGLCYEESYANNDQMSGDRSLKKYDSSWTSYTYGDKDIDKAFSNGVPIFASEETQFIDVDIPQTFIEKMKIAGLPSMAGETSMDFSEDTRKNDQNGSKRIAHIKEYLQAFKNQKSHPAEIETISSFTNVASKPYPATKGFFFSGNAEIDTDNLSIDDNQWLIIDGDATFESSGDAEMSVKANILVTGKITIRGKLSFNSVIYCLGSTTMNNVTITSYKTDANNSSNEDPVLILMTQSNLQIARINEFKKFANKINGYLYTAAEANIYAVGSLLNVEGGIFSLTNLTVNSFRGNTEEEAGATRLTFTTNENYEGSRLTLTNNKRLFLNQMLGLPNVDGLEVVPDRMEKIKNP